MPKISEEAKEARRSQIVDAAVRCFARTGYYATTIEDIVRETGVSKGALYLYFPSKEAHPGVARWHGRWGVPNRHSGGSTGTSPPRNPAWADGAMASATGQC